MNNEEAKEQQPVSEEHLPIVSDKGAEEVLRKICDKQFGGDFGGVDNDDWNNLLRENSDEGIFMRSAIQAMQEYATLREQQAKNEAIQDVKQLASKFFEGGNLKRINEELEKLKK